MKPIAAVLFAILVLSACAATADVDTRYLQGLGDTHYSKVSAKAIGRDFHVYVMLPEGYAEDTSKTYPTVYLMDGGTMYPKLVGYYRYLRFAEDVPDLIIVGLSYGSDRFAEGNYRATDYTAPADEPDYWGGAGAFQAFLKSELMPRIERKYRANADRRIVFGQSMGGQFVLYTALTEPQLFWGHIASNPALHNNLPFFLERHWADSSASTSSRVFVASASGDAPRFREPTLEWFDHWAGNDKLPWQLETRTIDDHNHMSLAPASFRKGLLWLFKDE
ncbi:MAG: alpha/beta hydrolase [Gammaproteobacteria bacterium]|nr:alpha/beta hydrolase [Gammaproteobacteria bacterium]